MNLKRLTRYLCFAILLLCEALVPAEARGEKSIYVPSFNAQVRARYEYLFQENKGGFKVRNLRLGVDGYVAPIMSYSAKVDFADWGKIVLIDAYIRLAPLKSLSFNLGQGRMPFGLAAHRQPCEQYFANRAFVAKHNGVRDIGLVGSYTLPKIPLTAQASFFNCRGTGENQKYFTNTYGFTVKLLSPFLPYWYATLSTARVTKGIATQQDWDIGAYFDNGLWHVEGEYLRRQYAHGAFMPQNVADFFVYRNFPIEKKMISGISGALRYDYMGDYSSGIPDEAGKLVADIPECHRLTAGATLTLQSKFTAAIRLNYEKYFMNKGAVRDSENSDRIILELIAFF